MNEQSDSGVFERSCSGKSGLKGFGIITVLVHLGCCNIIPKRINPEAKFLSSCESVKTNKSYAFKIKWSETHRTDTSNSKHRNRKIAWDYHTYTAAAAAAKSPQLCPTLCDPIDGSPPGSPVPLCL